MAGVERELAKISKDWTATVVVRTYQSGDKGEAAFAGEADVFAVHGYRPTTTSTEGSHPHAGKLTVTFDKADEAAAAPDLADQIHNLADLKEAGLLGQAESDAKKDDLLSRM